MDTKSGVFGGMLSLPQGGGALRSIGERFQPDLFKGAGNYTIPIEVPGGPGGVSPSLRLQYSTGQGDGPFGLGWSLAGLLDIRLRTDKGVPSYDHGVDELTLGGGELLIPVGNGRYCPQSDAQGLHIQRLDDGGFKIRANDGRSYLLGTTADSRVEDNGRVFQWLVDREEDTSGNAILYHYVREGGMLYVDRIEWSIYSLRFNYEERPDPIRDGRAGFQRIGRLRCSSINRLAESLNPPLLGCHRLGYTRSKGNGASMLTTVQVEGIGEDGTTEVTPPLTMGYSGHEATTYHLHCLDSNHPLVALSDPSSALVDMTANGLPDLLQTKGGMHCLWVNHGNGHFERSNTIRDVPFHMDIGERGVSFADLNGDGTADLFQMNGRFARALSNTGDGAWRKRPIIFEQQLAVDLSSTATRLVDLDGDGVVDILQSHPSGFLLLYNQGNKGFGKPKAIPRIADLEHFPDLDLGDPRVHLADMTGDGLADFVFATSGRVWYWPHFGHGNFGSRVRMERPPSLPQGFVPERLLLSDIDGDGVTDLLYVDHDRVLYWLNQGGHGWSEVHEISFIPPPDPDSLQMVDLMGTGLRGLLWHRGHKVFFLELHHGTKPYLMTTIETGIGGRTEIAYTTSTANRVADRERGETWQHKLPFPLQVVSEIRRTDAITGNTATKRFNYHSGYYDPVEREFRGFERVEMSIEGDDHRPTTVQETRFFQGEYLEPDSAPPPPEQRAKDRAIAGSPQEVKTFEVTDDGTRVLHQSTKFLWEVRLEHLPDDLAGVAGEPFAVGMGYVYFPHLVSKETRDHVPDEPDRIDRIEYQYDQYGNAVRATRRSRFSDQTEAETLTSFKEVTFAINESKWLVSLPALTEVTDGNGRFLSRVLHYYDGPAFQGLPNGEVTDGLLKRTEELVYCGAELPVGYADLFDGSWGLHLKNGDWYKTTAAFDHDSRGNVVRRKDPFGAEHRFTYDGYGLFPSEYHNLDDGETTYAEFDLRAGKPESLQLPNGLVTQYQYSPLGRLRAQFETVGSGDLELTQVYDWDFGDPATSPPRPNRIISIKPTAPGGTVDQLVGVDNLATLENVSVVCDYYDSSGSILERVQRAPNAEDGTARWRACRRSRYTAQGDKAADYLDEERMSFTYQPVSGAGQVQFYYGPLGQRTQTDWGAGERLLCRYLNNRIEKWDANTASDETPTTERYDAAGHLTQVEEPDGSGGVAMTRYAFDSSGRLTSVTDASGTETVNYFFAGPGPEIRISHIDAGERVYWYDAAGRLRQRKDSLGRCMVMEYDQRGRLLLVKDATNVANIRIVREQSYVGSELVEAREENIFSRYEYDAIGRITSRNLSIDGGRDLTVSYEYNFCGEVNAIVYPNGMHISYNYGPDGSVDSINGIVDRITYDALLNPTRIDFTGGLATEYTRDTVTQHLASAALVSGADLIRRVAFTTDNVGNILKVTDETPGEVIHRDFTYDRMGRLRHSVMTQITPPHGVIKDDNYEYTPSGDITRNDEALVGGMTYGDSHHPGHLTQVIPSGSTIPVEFEYDAGGRLISGSQIESIEYDIWDRPIQYLLHNGTEVIFAYDHLGVRVQKTVNEGAATNTTYHMDSLYDEGPNGKRLSVNLNGLKVAEIIKAPGIAPRTICLLTDHLGSVLSACEAGGIVMFHQRYSPFGLTLQASHLQDAFVGKHADEELALIHFGARYYAPMLGRFVTPDWYILENPSRALRIPQALNAYAYAINNPLAYQDSTGRFFWLPLLAAGAFFYGAGTAATAATEGENFGDAIMRGFETAGLTVAGAALGYVGGWIVGQAMSSSFLSGWLGFMGSGGGGALLSGFGATMGGFNGMVSGANGIYSGDAEGVEAFLKDSTWGIVGTGLGNHVHIANLFYGNRNYNSEESRAKNRHVYNGGFNLKANFAFTQGNVVSHAAPGQAPGILTGSQKNLLESHETLHIWQGRAFGPIFQGVYISWAVGGTALALFSEVWDPFTRGRSGASLGDKITTLAYFDNPFEVWAYSEQGVSSVGVGAHSDYAWS